MKTWSKADLLSIFLIIFGIVCLICSASSFLIISCFLFSSVILLHCVYKSRYDALNFRNILFNYHSALSLSKDGWIAWNGVNEYIGSSKNFRNVFGIKNSATIFFTDILSAIEKKDSDELSYQFNKLKKTGNAFNICVTPINSNKKIEIRGSKMTINGQETIALWSSDVTYSSSIISKLEEKLFTTEEYAESLQKILNTIPIPVWKRDEHLKIIYCNKAYAEVLEIPIEKIIQNNVPLVSGTLFGQGHSLAENVKKSNRDQSIAQSIIVKGVRKKFTVHENHSSSESLIGYAIDITNENNLSLNLDRVITANYEVLENLSTAIAIFGENTRLKFFNTSYQKLMKLEASWLHSKPTYGEILDERRNNRQLPEHADFQAFKKAQLSMFTSITSPVKELVHLPNGKALQLLITPYPLGGLLFMFEDVTDSLTLQRKNNTLLAVQKETINHLHEGIIVYGSDNRLKIINSSVMKIWNVDDKDIVAMKGIHLSEMLEYMKDSIDYGDDWSNFRINTISNFTDRIPKTGRIVRKDNSVILFSYIPLPDGAHMLSYTDITDTCVVEKAVMERNQALKEANRLRYEFISSISTELKEPINSLIGFSELLLKEYYGILNEKQREYCKYILSSSNQLHLLTNNLLEMVMIDVESGMLEISKFCINDTINEVITTIKNKYKEKGIIITTYFDDTAIQYNGDRKRIKQCLFNILINVMQVTPINGEIFIRILCSNEELKIIITDEQHEYKIAGKHKQNKTYIHKIVQHNTVSISIVRSLIEMHGGTLNITSASNAPSHIVCTLPMKDIKAKQNHQENTMLLKDGDENYNNASIDTDNSTYQVSKVVLTDDSSVSDNINIQEQSSNILKKIVNG